MSMEVEDDGAEPDYESMTIEQIVDDVASRDDHSEPWFHVGNRGIFIDVAREMAGCGVGNTTIHS